MKKFLLVTLSVILVGFVLVPSPAKADYAAPGQCWYNQITGVWMKDTVRYTDAGKVVGSTAIANPACAPTPTLVVRQASAPSSAPPVTAPKPAPTSTTSTGGGIPPSPIIIFLLVGTLVVIGFILWLSTPGEVKETGKLADGRSVSIRGPQTRGEAISHGDGGSWKPNGLSLGGMQRGWDVERVRKEDGAALGWAFIFFIAVLVFLLASGVLHL